MDEKLTICCFTGHRPEKLPWGADESDPRCVKLKEELACHLEGLYLAGCRHFICGMARGCDAYFAEGVLALREKYPRHRMHLVFQPHRLERVTRYGEQFAKLLSRCDWCGVLPPFGAWRTDGASVDVNHLLTDKITAPHQALTGEFGAMASAIVSSLSADAPTVLAIVGAGDVTKLTPLCLSLLP